MTKTRRDDRLVPGLQERRLGEPTCLALQEWGATDDRATGTVVGILRGIGPFGVESGRLKETNACAEERGGALVDNPRWARILAITAGSSMAAMIVKGPPQ